MSEESTPRVVKTTLQELGNVLPIGLIDGGERFRSFELRELEFPIEKALGEWKKERGEGKPLSAVVTKLMALLLTDIGGKPFEHLPGDSEQEEAKKLLFIKQLYTPDVYYMYTYARYQELGKEYIIPFDCGYANCKYSTDEMICDISTMEVNCAHDLSVLVKEVELHHGIKYVDGSIRKKVTITPMQWMWMDGPDIVDSQDELLLKLFFISKCVTGVEGIDGSLVLTQGSLNSLRKIDIERLDQAINKMNLWPSLVVSGDCHGCK